LAAPVLIRLLRPRLRIAAVARAARVDRFAAALPDGYERCWTRARPISRPASGS